MERTGRHDAGVSLIEVLIAVAIMGIAMVAIVAALGTQIAGTRVHRDQSNAAVVLAAAAESVKAAAYTPCATATTYASAAQSVTVPSDWIEKSWPAASAVTLTVAHWGGSSFGATCRDNEPADTAGLFRLQQIQVTARGPDGDQESVTIVKTGQAP